MQRAKAKADKDLEAEKLLREQKTKVILHRDGEWAEALLSLDVISVRQTFVNCFYRSASTLSLHVT